VEARNIDQHRRVVFTPAGKLSMLEGGIGCIRLKQIQFPHGTYWFMSASSTGSPDEGITVAIPNHYYPLVIEDIQRHGSCLVFMTGVIKLISEEYRELSAPINRIPQIYLEIERLEACPSEPTETEVSVAVSFKSDVFGSPQLYAAYVTFDPAISGSRSEAVDWLKTEYVKGRYKGEVVTDFDQQAKTFSRVLFSLESVMVKQDIGGIINKIAKDDTLQSIGELKGWNVAIIKHFYGEVVMGDKVKGDKIRGDKIGGDKNVISGSRNATIASKSSGTTISVTQLPDAASVDITKELLALKKLLAQLKASGRKKNIEAAMTKAIDETKRANPDKGTIGAATERALKIAAQADDFTSKVEKVVPRIKQVAGWLGENWHKLLPLVGVGIAAG
jgi:hypothetical protein